MKAKLQELGRLIKFGLVGVLNTLIDMAVFFILASLWHVSIYLAQTIGYAAGTVNSYCLNRSWTFHSSEKFFSAQAVKFLLSNLIVLAFSLLPIKICTEFLHLGNGWTKIITTCFTLALNFLISRLWVFSPSKQETSLGKTEKSSDETV